MNALVTGAGVRLGRAISLALAEAGFDLILHANRSVEPAYALAAELEQRGHRARVLAADLSAPEQCRALARQVSEQLPHLSLLVNNAGLYEAVPIETLTLAQWERMQAVNCRAPFLLTQALLPSLRASPAGHSPSVVNIGDIGGARPVPGFLHYSVSKAGLLMLTRALSVELAPQVRVNAVSPGTVLPPEDLAPDVLDAILGTIPLGRVGCAEDIAKAVVFLATQAPYMTGQILEVDGGRGVSGPMSAG